MTKTNKQIKSPIKILITRKIPPIAQEILTDFDVTQNENDPLTKEEFIKAVQTYDGILSTFLDPIDSEILSHATKTKVISNYAVGLDNIALDIAKEKEIEVFNLPDEVTQSTAEMTFALLLACFKNLPQANQFIKEDKWARWEPSLFLGQELKGKTIGIVGFGRIGQAVAKIALAFGMNVLFYRRQPFSFQHCKQVDLDTLLHSSDVVSIHTPLTDETKEFVDLAFFKKMKPSATFLNLARGKVVKQEDLIYALENNLIKNAGLDVMTPEPLGKNHPLAKLDNVILTPHIGTATKECRESMAKKAARNLLNFFSK